LHHKKLPLELESLQLALRLLARSFFLFALAILLSEALLPLFLLQFHVEAGSILVILFDSQGALESVHLPELGHRCLMLVFEVHLFSVLDCEVPKSGALFLNLPCDFNLRKTATSHFFGQTEEPCLNLSLFFVVNEFLVRRLWQGLRHFLFKQLPSVAVSGTYLELLKDFAVVLELGALSRHNVRKVFLHVARCATATGRLQPNTIVHRSD